MKNTKLTDKELAEKLYMALVWLTGNFRLGLGYAPEHAKPIRELVECSSVGKVTALEYAEQMEHLYRQNNPERWDAKALEECRNSHKNTPPLVPMSVQLASSGGKARAKSMSAARRKAIAKKAAKTRWA